MNQYMARLFYIRMAIASLREAVAYLVVAGLPVDELRLILRATRNQYRRAKRERVFMERR